MKENKVVGISNWFLCVKLIVNIGVLTLVFIFSSLFLSSAYPNIANVELYGFYFAIIVSFVLFIGDLLYWKRSGIYYTNNNHLVRRGGWMFEEHKLLNTVVIANQVYRSPLDQLLGTATIHAGILQTRKNLYGVRLKDIKKYDDLMQANSIQTTSTVL